MKYLGLVLIPLLVVFIFAGPGCQQAQDEPEVEVEEVIVEAEEVPSAVEEVVAEEVVVDGVIEEVEVVEEVEVDVDPEEGRGLLKQLQEKGEEEVQKQVDENEVDKKIDELGM